ncbi:phage tail protein [Nocardia rhizosphaerihabitans]|uniref:Phage tail protein n=1 Tax=Nocardia rhizosphaerihabitans TaxID=1691570 RepID=A0ABQ2K7F5_9NOCA|nr:phage tail protein [Nocardia rhizosphaerihabitans]GGN66032.1 hypothetical protein GCM10011610_00540 [Nocardia rhizosphaerihabitans]
MTEPDGVTIKLREDQIETAPLSESSSGSGQITITRDGDKRAAFTDWIEQTSDGQQAPLTVTVLDEQRQQVRRIHLSNAWASRWEGPSLHAGDSGVAIESVTITYEDITVD